jgi:hypothetical protein
MREEQIVSRLFIVAGHRGHVRFDNRRTHCIHSNPFSGVFERSRFGKPDHGEFARVGNKEPIGLIWSRPVFSRVKKYFEPIGLLSDSSCCGTTEKV